MFITFFASEPFSILASFGLKWWAGPISRLFWGVGGGSGMPAKDGNLYAGSYRRRAKALRDAANADPGTVCWRCGIGVRSGDPWVAGHVRGGDPESPLSPEHRSCNSSDGGKSGMTRFPTSRPW